MGLNTRRVAALNRSVRFSPDTRLMSGRHRLIDGRPIGVPFTVSFSQLFLQPLGARGRAVPMQSNEERDFMVYQRERVKVDETRWLPFLRKHRWFDWAQVSLTSVQSRRRELGALMTWRYGPYGGL
ncbi:hypothetical protein F5B18DRAFT_268031 [Nemania serpens]|nr:hypothetical protein F5B18DRAFT_268031 [Nemania serpens]